jgi:hypothetical protein
VEIGNNQETSALSQAIRSSLQRAHRTIGA